MGDARWRDACCAMRVADAARQVGENARAVKLQRLKITLA